MEKEISIILFIICWAGVMLTGTMLYYELKKEKKNLIEESKK